MLNIVVFNWNYSEFLGKLLSEMQVIFNNSQYRIVICDDGSTDNSLELVDAVISKFDIKNITIFKSKEANFGREKPYQGQLESLNKVMESDFFSLSEHYWFMDADDYCIFSDLSNDFIERVVTKKVCFTRVKNITREGIETDKLIKRSVVESKNLFPSISVTSSIIASGAFLSEYKDKIFHNDFDDVWLDARINMLACLLEIRDVAYVDEVVFRLIHGSNDSGKMSTIRMLRKQISAHDYFRFINNNKFMINPRMLILTVLSKFKKILRI
ncbi:Family 2 glycosyltransferase [Vibrio owensii]|uniref:hypothetical protein n=1 Tax=Vibrio owensii TaxID=696485 RepID=UPI002895CBAF|nr:Family 2 glycosyltransferase [Vibrio owensii]